MKSLKLIQYILIAVFFIFIAIVVFNINFKSTNKPDNKFQDLYDIKSQDNLSNIIYDGKNKLYESGKQFAIMEFKTLKEETNGTRIINGLKIILLKSQNIIKCDEAEATIDGTIKMKGKVYVTDSNGKLNITFSPPVTFHKKELYGDGLVEITDNILKQSISGNVFLFSSDEKKITIKNNVVFVDSAKNIKITSESSYSKFQDKSILFVKDVKVSMKNDDGTLSTSVLFLQKESGEFYFSGYSKYINNNSILYMTDGRGKSLESGNITFSSQMKTKFESNLFIGNADSIQADKNRFVFKKFISTNGLINFITPSLIYIRNKNIGFGNAIFLRNNDYFLKGRNYEINTLTNSLKIDKPILTNLSSKEYLVANKVEITNQSKVVFSRNIKGKFNQKTFFGEKLIVERNIYRLLQGGFSESSNLLKTISADSIKLENDTIFADKNVKMVEANKTITSDSAKYLNEEIIFSENVKMKSNDTLINSDKAFVKKSYSVFLNGKLQKGDNYFAQSKIMFNFKYSNKIICIGDSLFIDKSTGKASGDSLTLDVSTDTIKLIGTKKKAKVEFKYEKKASNK